MGAFILQQKRFRFSKKILGFVLLVIFFQPMLLAQNTSKEDYTEYSGNIVELETNKPLSGVHITLAGGNIATISNSVGGFSIKIPNHLKNGTLSFSKVNYEKTSVQLRNLNPDHLKIKLPKSSTTLETVKLYKAKDPMKLVIAALQKRSENKAFLTGFYREIIDRGKAGSRNAVLGEAVVQIDENGWTQGRPGKIRVFKSRKSTNSRRIDTLAVKFKGGPYSGGIYMDMMKYPEFVFKEGNFNDFDYKFESPTNINGRYVYVVHFEHKNQILPFYIGELFIDAETNGLVKASYSLNVDNHKIAQRMLVARKPRKYKVTPLYTHYEVEYVLRNGKWDYSYSHFTIQIAVHKKHRLFNRRYTINSELVITDRNTTPFFAKKNLKKISPTVIMTDNIVGFADPDFWGPNNIIEPNQSIKKAIEDIQKRIHRN